MVELSVNLKRLMDTFKISHQIGKIQEKGLRRLALTPEDKIMRDIFTDWLERENLNVRVDDFGNIYGRREGLRSDLPPVVMGSHLDTQPYGGRYDGVLGVLSALEMIKVLNENNIQTIRPIEIVNFTNEEGTRFSSTSGSEGITNISTKEELYNDKDEDGKKFGDELKKIGYLGDEKNRLNDIHSYVELHIEQGPVLFQENKSIGIVTGDAGNEVIELIVKGETGHPTATPMAQRKDALIKAAKIIVKAEEIIRELNGIFTIGNLGMEPRGFHIISEAKIIMTVQHDNKEMRKEIIHAIEKESKKIVEKSHMNISIRDSLFAGTSACFSDYIKDEIESVAETLGYSSHRLVSRGFHDANNISTIAPTGMIFIPCKDGISHSIEEFASEQDIKKGANVLLNTVLSLAQLENPLA